MAEVQVDEREHEILLGKIMGRWLLLEKGAFPWLGCPEWDATPVGVEGGNFVRFVWWFLQVNELQDEI